MPAAKSLFTVATDTARPSTCTCPFSNRTGLRSIRGLNVRMTRATRRLVAMLRLFPIEPFCYFGRLMLHQPPQQGFLARIGNYHSLVDRLHELLVYGMIEQRQESIIITIDIQNAARFPMQAKLGPREDLTEFFQGPVAARQSDESIREFCHLCFSLVH